MRVLYLNSSGGLGGAETSLLSLLEGLRGLHRHWELKLLLGEDGPLASRAAALGVAVQVLPLPERLAGLGESYITRHLATGKLLSSALPILRYRNHLNAAVRNARPDVIHSNGIKMHLLAAWTPQGRPSARSRVVCHMHDYAGSRPMSGRLLRLSSGRFNTVVANSCSVARDLIKLGLPRQQVTTIYNGIPMSRFTPYGPKADLDLLSGLANARPNAVRVGLPATFAKWKGHLTFLRAMALLPEQLNVRAYVIGGPVYRTADSQCTLGELRAEAARLGVGERVGFTGIVDNMVEAIRALDIVVHASTEPEPFGMVIIEAMACGKPVIVSDAGGASEIIEDGVTALGYKPGDTVTLAGHIGRLARYTEVRVRLGKGGRAAVAARFQASTMAQRFAEVYCRVAERDETRLDSQSEMGEKCFALD